MGKPVHLFRFERQTLVHRFANDDRGHVIGGAAYLGASIEREGIRETAESAKDILKIRMPFVRASVAPAEGWPVTQSLGQWWRPYMPADPIRVVCLDWQRGSVDPPLVAWSGWVAGIEFEGIEMILSCNPFPPGGDFRNQGFKWQRNCCKAVYSTGPRGCNLDPEPLTVTGELTAVSGLTLTAAEFAGSAFPLLGGRVRWERVDGVIESRPIIAHRDDEIDILWGGLGLATGVEVHALPNCEQTWAACSARHAQPELHYGGSVYKLGRDPVQSSM